MMDHQPFIKYIREYYPHIDAVAAANQYLNDAGFDIALEAALESMRFGALEIDYEYVWIALEAGFYHWIRNENPNQAFLLRSTAAAFKRKPHRKKFILTMSG